MIIYHLLFFIARSIFITSYHEFSFYYRKKILFWKSVHFGCQNRHTHHHSVNFYFSWLSLKKNIVSLLPFTIHRALGVRTVTPIILYFYYLLVFLVLNVNKLVALWYSPQQTPLYLSIAPYWQLGFIGHQYFGFTAARQP